MSVLTGSGWKVGSGRRSQMGLQKGVDRTCTRTCTPPPHATIPLPEEAIGMIFPGIWLY